MLVMEDRAATSGSVGREWLVMPVESPQKYTKERGRQKGGRLTNYVQKVDDPRVIAILVQNLPLRVALNG